MRCQKHQLQHPLEPKSLTCSVTEKRQLLYQAPDHRHPKRRPPGPETLPLAATRDPGAKADRRIDEGDNQQPEPATVGAPQLKGRPKRRKR